MIYLYKRQILEKFHGRKLVVWKKYKIKGVLSALTPCVHYESIIHYLYFCISVRVCSCESAPGGDEGGVVGVCMFLSILTAG